MPERLQKILAQAGYGSRRACEDFISAGRVRVNGQLAELGQKADPAVDKITVDGKPIAAAESRFMSPYISLGMCCQRWRGSGVMIARLCANLLGARLPLSCWQARF